MRLSKIKLAGFKSFVDPTTINLPSNLLSILGPNGCGKSNTIDAVRWVMGESSAKNLRGDSMTDVIFNGAASRKPVGQATVELVFDNSDGTISGQYASFNEISVKRTVNREAQSIYYLNNTRCRRRDITDLFAGTGLGPRSYSIIEQGMISRLIESKPEELRVYIEEAAGISKYKDRRKETETRIRHTRENLERLEDIRNELSTQLARLQRQARTAERYKELKHSERLIKAQLAALRWRNIDEQAHQQQQLINERETALEQLNAELRNIELGLENSREEHINANEHFNQVQGEFYRIGGEIARLEQSIEHIRERQKQHKEDYAEALNSLQQAQQHLSVDSDKMEKIQEQIDQLEPEFDQTQEASEIAAEKLLEFESQIHDLQQKWDDFSLTAQQPIQTAQIERTKISQLEQHQSQAQQRLEKLKQEMAQFSDDDLQVEIDQLNEELLIAKQLTEEMESSLEQQKELSRSLHEEYQLHNESLNESRNQLQTANGRLASMEALQQAALGKQESSKKDSWVEQNNLQENKRLAQQLQVDTNWEKALECVLGDYLEAVCLDDFSSIYQQIDTSNQNQSVNLFENTAPNQTITSSSAIDLPRLSDFVQGYQPINSIIDTIHTAENLQQALQWREQLPCGFSIITKDAVWLGSNWIKTIDEDKEKSGVFEREKIIQELKQEITETEALISEQKLQTEQVRDRQQEEEAQRDQLQLELNGHNKSIAELNNKLNTKNLRVEQIKNRKERLLSDIEELNGQLESDAEQILIANEILHQALEQADLVAEEKENLQIQREAHREQLNDYRDAARQERDKSHSLEIRLKGLRSEYSSTEQALNRIKIQLSGLQNRCNQLKELLDSEEDPEFNLREELEEYLALKLETDELLSQARNQVDQLEQDLRQYDAKRSQTEHKLQDIRSQLEQIRLHLQELKIKRQTQQENVEESEYSMQELFLQIPEDASEEDWLEETRQLAKKIQSLGSINLAAIDEYQEQSKRKEYLDSQNNDLMQAMATLKGAIAKIDKETRTRFKETFDHINTGLQQLFPRLFGGGHAYLELTGDDLLDTGVTIMARPPGKRNSTIHLLSGGEKAMTAVALVFAIFSLNPAPFCMLDEVDAPLDEANVGRFCAMVKEMSEQVQFIYITHNKTTMEMSEHLCGVTMKEAGVSRIVDVDIAEAVDMVET